MNHLVLRQFYGCYRQALQNILRRALLAIHMTLATKRAPERPRAQGKLRESSEEVEEWLMEGPRRPRRKKKAQKGPQEGPRGKVRAPGGGKGPRRAGAQGPVGPIRPSMGLIIAAVIVFLAAALVFTAAASIL